MQIKPNGTAIMGNVRIIASILSKSSMNLKSKYVRSRTAMNTTISQVVSVMLKYFHTSTVIPPPTSNAITAAQGTAFIGFIKSAKPTSIRIP